MKITNEENETRLYVEIAEHEALKAEYEKYARESYQELLSVQAERDELAAKVEKLVWEIWNSGFDVQYSKDGTVLRRPRK